MIPKRMVESALKRYRELRKSNPDLLNDDANAIIVAASNDAIAQAIRSLAGSIKQRGVSPSIDDALEALDVLKASWDATD